MSNSGRGNTIFAPKANATLAAEKLIPGKVLRHLQSMPGNERCCDCFSEEASWGSVSHGTLLCISCAGVHRSMGVNVSFVRSLHMDTWSECQLEMMRQGGNAQLKDYFSKLKIDDLDPMRRYRTKGAQHYRTALQQRAESIVRGDIAGGPGTRVAAATVAGPEVLVHPTSSVPALARAPAVTAEVPTPSSSSRQSTIRLYSVSFKDAPLGFSLQQDSLQADTTSLLYSTLTDSAAHAVVDSGANDCSGSVAVVSIVVPGQQAALQGVQPLDRVVGVNGRNMHSCQQAMQAVRSAVRPLFVTFQRGVSQPISVAETQAPIVSLSGSSGSSKEMELAVQLSDAAEGGARHRSSSGSSANNISRPPPLELHPPGVLPLFSPVVTAIASENVDHQDQKSEREKAASPKTTSGGRQRSASGRAHSPRAKPESPSSVPVTPASVVATPAKRTPVSAESQSRRRSSSTAVTPPSGSRGSASKSTKDKTGHSRRPSDERVSPSVWLLDGLRADEGGRRRSGDGQEPTAAFASLSMSAADEKATPATPVLAAPKPTGPSEMRVVFAHSPLGLTLTRSSAGMAIVTRVVPTGQAQELGVREGDVVVGVGSGWTGDYAEVMQAIQAQQQFPYSILFRRGITAARRATPALSS